MTLTIDERLQFVAEREIAAAAKPHPCSAATPSSTSAPLEATKKTKGIPSSRAWSAASASLTPSAWVMAPRRIVPSDRAMTALCPPILPTTEVTAPTIPLPTSGASSRRLAVVTGVECRPPPRCRLPSQRSQGQGRGSEKEGVRGLQVVGLGPPPRP